MPNYPDKHLIEQAATALLDLPRQVARAQFGDRVARAFLLANEHEKACELDFNARLATEVRERARLRHVPSLWGDDA